MKAMKKLGLFLLTAFAAVGLASCNSSSSDGPTVQSFVTVHKGFGSDYSFETDAGRTIWPGDKSNIGSYEAVEGARALIYYSLLDMPAEGYNLNVKLYGIVSVTSAPVEVVDTQEKLDAMKKDLIVGAGGQLVGGWINFIVRYVASSENVAKHKFHLIVNETAEPVRTKEGYLNLELRHDAGSEYSGLYYDCALSFNTASIAELLEGKEGIIVSYYDGTQEQWLEIKRTDIETAAQL